MARVLGLDLGSYSLKAMVLESSGRGARQLSYVEIERPAEGEKLDTLKAALAGFLEAQPSPSEMIVVAPPGSTLTIHPLALPFTDPKRIDATLPFELESQLPFELDAAIYDYQSPTRRDAKVNVLAGVIRREELSGLLEALAEKHLDPRVVVHPAIALHSIMAFAPQLLGDPTGDGVIAIIDVGHERTTVAIGRAASGIEWARTFNGGGRDLNRALANELQISLAEAQTLKETEGAIGGQVSGNEAERVSAALQRGLQNVLREIRGTFKAYAAANRGAVERVYLAGGTAKLPGLEEHFVSELGLPTQLLGLPQEVDAVVPKRGQSSAVLSYALALRGSMVGSRAPRFNLRRGEFVFKRDADTMRDQLVRLGVYAAGLAMLFIAFTVTRSSLLSRREKEVDHQLCIVTEKVLGKCEPNYDRALNLLRGKESPTGAIPRHSAVGLLAEMNDRIPKDLPVKLNQVDIDLERIMLRGEADSPAKIDNLEQALKTSPCFKETKTGKVEKAHSGTGVSFRLDVQVQCPDQEAKQ